MANTLAIRLGFVLILIFRTDASEKCEGEDLYFIRTFGKVQVLDASEADQVRIQRFTGSDAQLWRFKPAGKPGSYYIVNEHHNKVLDFNKKGDLLHVVVTELQGSTQQKWNFNELDNIVNSANGKNVDIYRDDYTDGNPLVLWDDNGCGCQMFYVQKKS